MCVVSVTRSLGISFDVDLVDGDGGDGESQNLFAVKLLPNEKIISIIAAAKPFHIVVAVALLACLYIVLDTGLPFELCLAKWILSIEH